MPFHTHLTVLFLITALAASGCSRKEPEGTRSGEESEEAAEENEAGKAAVRMIRAGARALAQPGASVDYVAAEMKGVIDTRTKSQALMEYDGYVVIMTTPADQVTRITFNLSTAKPTIGQLTDAFGEPEEHPKGLLYLQTTEATSSTVKILAEPDALPAKDGGLVHRVTLEGKRGR